MPNESCPNPVVFDVAKNGVNIGTLTVDLGRSVFAPDRGIDPVAPTFAPNDTITLVPRAADELSSAGLSTGSGAAIADDRAHETDEIEITPEMIDAGAYVILCEVGGADLGGFFSAPELAKLVYLAMRAATRPLDGAGIAGTRS